MLMPPVNVRFKTIAATRRLSPEGVKGSAAADCEAIVIRPDRDVTPPAPFSSAGPSDSTGLGDKVRSVAGLWKDPPDLFSVGLSGFDGRCNSSGTSRTPGGNDPAGVFSESGIPVAGCEGNSTAGGFVPFGAPEPS